MQNKILEDVIDAVIDQSDQSPAFQAMLKRYIKNKFDGNADDSDLKTVWDCMEDTEVASI